MHHSMLSTWVYSKELMSSIPKGWILTRIGDIVEKVDTRIEPHDNIAYKLAGVQWYGKGLFHRETLYKTEIEAKYIYPIEANMLVYNRLFAWKGSFAISLENDSDMYVSNEFPRYRVSSQVYPEYLYLYCMTDIIQKEILGNSVGSSAVSRNRLKEEAFESIQIPLPNRTIQEKIINEWKIRNSKIACISRSSEDKINQIVDQVLKSSDINIQDSSVRSKSYAIPFSGIDRWGVEFNRHTWTLQDLLVSNKYASVLLQDVAIINPQNKVIQDKNLLISFVPMEAVVEDSGQIVSALTRPYHEVATGYTRFSNGDVIWAKITPCMQNGKCAVAKDLENGIGVGSTEFHVIRSKDENVLLPDYIWMLLRLKSIRKAATRFFIGSSGQQRVPAEFLKELSIPLPPINIQYEIRQKIETIQDVLSENKRQIADLKISLHDWINRAMFEEK